MIRSLTRSVGQIDQVKLPQLNTANAPEENKADKAVQGNLVKRSLSLTAVPISVTSQKKYSLNDQAENNDRVPPQTENKKQQKEIDELFRKNFIAQQKIPHALQTHKLRLDVNNDIPLLGKNFFSKEDIKAMRESLKELAHFHKMTNNNLYLIAHRGMGPTSVLGQHAANFDIPAENTIESFKRAIILGCDGFELDIFKSKDEKIMVIHDDELNRNVFGADRKGLRPADFNVAQKTAAEIQEFSVGARSEKVPLLTEVFDLVKDANTIRRAEGNRDDLIINIEIKDKTAVDACLNLIEKYIKSNPQSGVDFNNIKFCSFNHESLIYLKEQAKMKGHDNINIAPGIKTATLFGKDNIDNNFCVKKDADPVYAGETSLDKLTKEELLLDLQLQPTTNPLAYRELQSKLQSYLPKNKNSENAKEGLPYVKDLVHKNNFSGYDSPLFDIYEPLAGLARNQGKELHASTSDFRDYSDPAFARALIKMSENGKVFFKCDDVVAAKKVLMQESYLQQSGIGPQMLVRPNVADTQTANTYHIYKGSRHRENNDSLDELLKKPVPFSKTIQSKII